MGGDMPFSFVTWSRTHLYPLHEFFEATPLTCMWYVRNIIVAGVIALTAALIIQLFTGHRFDPKEFLAYAAIAVSLYSFAANHSATITPPIRLAIRHDRHLSTNFGFAKHEPELAIREQYSLDDQTFLRIMNRTKNDIEIVAIWIETSKQQVNMLTLTCREMQAEMPLSIKGGHSGGVFYSYPALALYLAKTDGGKERPWLVMQASDGRTQRFSLPRTVVEDARIVANIAPIENSVGSHLPQWSFDLDDYVGNHLKAVSDYYGIRGSSETYPIRNRLSETSEYAYRFNHGTGWSSYYVFPSLTDCLSALESHGIHEDEDLSKTRCVILEISKEGERVVSIGSRLILWFTTAEMSLDPYARSKGGDFNKILNILPYIRGLATLTIGRPLQSYSPNTATPEARKLEAEP